MVAPGILGLTILMKPSLSEGGGRWGKDLRNAAVVMA